MSGAEFSAAIGGAADVRKHASRHARRDASFTYSLQCNTLGRAVRGHSGQRILMTLRIFVSLLLVLATIPVARTETPEQWVALLTRVHGGFGSFLPVGIRIGEDAMKRLGAKPRELDVTFYQGEDTPCPCAADGASLAVYASAGQGTLHIAPEKSPPGAFAVVVIKPRKGGEGLKYTVPISVMPKLAQINSTIADPLGRYDAVMAIQNLFTVEPTK
jgi:hypothetical protein